MYRTFLISLVLVVQMFTVYGSLQAATPVSRAQALKALNSSQAESRYEAVARLADVGLMQDSEALVARLRDADDTVREAAHAALWQVWARSGDKAVDKLYQRGVSEMSAGQPLEAIGTFTAIIKLKPDFAEGWNKRATVYYFVGEWEKSRADCDEVLKRNPFHFGALSGYGQIYLQLDQPAKALTYFEKALAINPTMHAVAKNIEGLQRTLKRSRDKMI
jgi:tetratricopeptide (TPR) repeat protein